MDTQMELDGNMDGFGLLKLPVKGALGDVVSAAQVGLGAGGAIIGTSWLFAQPLPVVGSIGARLQGAHPALVPAAKLALGAVGVPVAAKLVKKFTGFSVPKDLANGATAGLALVGVVGLVNVLMGKSFALAGAQLQIESPNAAFAGAALNVESPNRFGGLGAPSNFSAVMGG